MDKSPITDKTLAIPHFSEADRFAEVRSKAKREWEDRHIKAKRNRKDPVPEYRIDQEIVLAKGYYKGNREYVLIRVLDFEETDRSFIYYGLVLKVTEKKMLDRVGRLISTSGSWFGYYPANVTPDKIKWVEEKNVKSS
jgi:hypothetical protein